MKKLVLLLMCLCMVGCKTDNTESAFAKTTTASETTVGTTTTAEATSVSETTGETTTTTVETTTVPETTTVTTTTTAETTTVPETTTVTTTTTVETTTVPETTTVTITTTAETTTVPETTTAATTTTAETTAVPDDGYDIIEVEGKRYKLTFEDSFEGDALDESKWERCPEWKRQDLECYWDNDKSYVDGEGNLIIETAYDETADRYLCGAVRTKGKFEQAYGYLK